jgi:hypothetical protein
VTTGRDWYPTIFAELERTGATEARIGVREVPDEEPGIWIEFFGDGLEGLWVCELEDAPLFLDSISDGEVRAASDFGECFESYFDDGDQDEGDEEGA